MSPLTKLCADDDDVAAGKVLIWFINFTDKNISDKILSYFLCTDIISSKTSICKIIQ
jgi:hypothetical protein